MDSVHFFVSNVPHGMDSVHFFVGAVAEMVGDFYFKSKKGDKMFKNS
jgi:hypothetical protein